MTVCEFSAPMMPIRIGFNLFSVSAIIAEAKEEAENGMVDSAAPAPTVFIKDLLELICCSFKCCFYILISKILNNLFAYWVPFNTTFF